MAESSILKPVKDNADWTGAEISSGDGWRYILDQAEINDLKKMATDIRPLTDGDPNRLMSIALDKFKLGTFAPRLKQIYAGLKNGAGIAHVKGLPIHELNSADIATIYWGIGQHLGSATPNNPDGDMFGHITDLGKTQKDPNSRGYQTRERMDYHCDQCDIVGLICIRAAKSGGVSMVASSVRMYNELIRRHPELAEALAQPLYWTKHGEYAEGELPYYQSPVFNFIDDKLCTSFGPKHIEKGHALPDTPGLSTQQRDAIRVAEEIANEHRYDMILEPGDMQFLNNYVALHTRSEYVDYDDPASKRLLWRLWLMNSDMRPRTAYSRQWNQGVGLGSEHNQIRL